MTMIVTAEVGRSVTTASLNVAKTLRLQDRSPLAGQAGCWLSVFRLPVACG